LPATWGELQVIGVQHWLVGIPVDGFVDELQTWPPVHTPVQSSEPPQPSLNVPHVPAGWPASTAWQVVGVQQVLVWLHTWPGVQTAAAVQWSVPPQPSLKFPHLGAIAGEWQFSGVQPQTFGTPLPPQVLVPLQPQVSVSPQPSEKGGDAYAPVSHLPRYCCELQL
jgi:hypothetical protein